MERKPTFTEHRFAEVIGQLRATNFTVQPRSGPAFVQMAAQFFQALSAHAERVAELQALDVPVKLIWGQWDMPEQVAGEMLS